MGIRWSGITTAISRFRDGSMLNRIEYEGDVSDENDTFGVHRCCE